MDNQATWLHLSNHGNGLLCLVIPGYAWLYLVIVILGYTWLCVVMGGYTCMVMDGYTWLCLDIGLVIPGFCDHSLARMF